MIKNSLSILLAIAPNIKKLLTPLSFLALRNSNLIAVQWIIPTIMTGVIFLATAKLGSSVLFSYEKLMSGMNSLVGALVGFYIAALAATATFPNEKLDMDLAGSPTTLKTKRSGKVIYETITRRRYMTVIFGYCSFVSISLFTYGLIQTNVFLSKDIGRTAKLINDLLFDISWFLYIWFIMSLFSATLIGLHYLIDRMHRD